MLAFGENGVAAVRLTPDGSGGIRFDEVFRLGLNPISSFDLGDLTGDGYDDIILGKPDGYVFVLDNRGKIVAQTLAGDQVWAVKRLRTRRGAVIAVAVDDDLAFYDTELHPIARTSPGRITAIDCVSGEDQDDLFIFGATRWYAAKVHLPAFERGPKP